MEVKLKKAQEAKIAVRMERAEAEAIVLENEKVEGKLRAALEKVLEAEEEA